MNTLVLSQYVGHIDKFQKNFIFRHVLDHSGPKGGRFTGTHPQKCEIYDFNLVKAQNFVTQIQN